MGTFFIPFDMTHIGFGDLKATFPSDAVFIAGREWKFERSVNFTATARTTVDRIEAAQNALSEFDAYCLWTGLFRMAPIRIYNREKIVIDDGKYDLVSIVGHPVFTPRSNAIPGGGGVSAVIRIALSGRLDENFITPKDALTQRHMNATRIFLDACFSNDPTAEFILAHAALEVLCKTRFPKDKNRIQKYLNESENDEIKTLDPNLISMIVKERNSIAHDGKPIDSSLLIPLREITRRLLQIEIYDTIDGSEHAEISRLFFEQSSNNG